MALPLPGIIAAYRATVPSGLVDLQERRAAGWPGFVYELRFCGVYLTREIILRRGPVRGLVISTVDADDWSTEVYPLDGKMKRLLQALSQSRLRKKREDGSMLLDGLAWDEGYLQRWPQTWLCAPTEALGEEALAEMAAFLKSRYTGHG